MERIHSKYNVYIVPAIIFIIEVALFVGLGVQKGDYFSYYDHVPLYVHIYAIAFSMFITIFMIYKLTEVKDIYYLIEVMVISYLLPTLVIPAIQDIIMNTYSSDYINHAKAMIFFNYIEKWYYFPLKIGIEIVCKSIGMILFLVPIRQKSRWKMVGVILLANIVVASGCILNLI